MKTLLTFFIITILFNINTSAQKETNSGGRGQESGRIERIDRDQDRKSPINNPQRKIKEEPNKPVVKVPERSLKRNDGTPFCGETESYRLEKTPICGDILDISYYQPSNDELANQFFESGDFGRALLHVELAIKFDLFNPSLYFLRGQIYFELYDYILAKRDFSTVVVFDSEFAEAYYYRGMCNLFLGDKELAMEDFEIATSLGDTQAERFVMKYSN
jgi:tetratricopeptide (TPR) repeat protein